MANTADIIVDMGMCCFYIYTQMYIQKISFWVLLFLFEKIIINEIYQLGED